MPDLLLSRWGFTTSLLRWSDLREQQRGLQHIPMNDVGKRKEVDRAVR